MAALTSLDSYLEHFGDLRQYLGLNSDARAAPQSEESHFN